MASQSQNPAAPCRLRRCPGAAAPAQPELAIVPHMQPTAMRRLRPYHTTWSASRPRVRQSRSGRGSRTARCSRTQPACR
eukprot:4532193-Alexandrium_andersonii.AAC.1